ncbi:MAG: putative ABC exporter domain-containing protein [Erysipelotrichaceae bacterium]|nr:putative ABC exporter domain-containing protein [Erysipelotrichaceae bacterium]MDD3924915.1 putative ABC exporter domain-containing protein [Erysipelotrichaceae bacterium]
MNSAIIYLFKTTIINTLKLTLHKPLKMFGFLFMLVYFLAVPFMMQSLINTMHLNDPSGFVFLGSMSLVYISLPSTLSYLKRKGVNFRQSDINLVFATSIDPKYSLIYGLLKSAYMSLVLQLAILIAAIFVFNVPMINALTYSLSDIILANISSYSIALIMYGSENLTFENKKLIRNLSYLLLGIITVFILFKVFVNGLSVVTVKSLIYDPLILMIPYFGWQISFLQMMILGPSLVNIIGSILYIILTIVVFLYAFKMPCQGEYYEDALSFAEDYEKLLEKNRNGDRVFFSNKASKIFNTDTRLKGQYGQLIFSRQFLSHLRQHRYFIRFFDLVHLAIGCLLIFMFNDLFDSASVINFFYMTIIITIYLNTFFAGVNNWRKEFDQYSFFLIPASNSKKLFYATLFEHVSSVIRSCLLLIPVGISSKMSVFVILLAVGLYVSLRAMIIYSSILFKDIVANKLNQTLASLLNMFFNLTFAMIPVGISMLLILYYSLSAIFIYIFMIIYCLFISWLILMLDAKILSHSEALR